MKRKLSTLKYLIAGTAAALLFSNCATYYDAQGRPVQAVDPAAAAIGAVAVGAAAYAIGKNNDGYRHHRGYYAPRYYRPRRFR